MREIKFRAWHQYHEWIYFVITPTNENVDHTVSFASPVGVQMMREGLTYWGQYTGLKDRNGKEIYEGDIVQIPEGLKFQVRWDARRGQWGGVVRDENEIVDTIFFNQEVIGNIFENPELISAEK